MSLAGSCAISILDPDDAIRAHLDLHARLSIGTHFGCFQLTDEGIDDPVIELEARRQHHNVAAESFQVLETGETRVFGRELTQEVQDARVVPCGGSEGLFEQRSTGQ